MHHRINISALIVIFSRACSTLIFPRALRTHTRASHTYRLVLKLAGLLPRVYSTCVLSPTYRLQRASSFVHLSRISTITRSRPLQVFYHPSSPLHITVQVVPYTTTALAIFFQYLAYLFNIWIRFFVLLRGNVNCHFVCRLSGWFNGFSITNTNNEKTKIANKSTIACIITWKPNTTFRQKIFGIVPAPSLPLNESFLKWIVN